MAGISVNEDFAASAADVWQKLSDFGGLAGWMPGIKSCELKGQGVGAVRTIAMGPIQIVERLESLDNAKRRLSYALLEGPMPLKNFLATIEVTEKSPTSCRVDWSASFDLPPGVSQEQIAPGIEAGYGGGLKALKARVER